MSSMPDRGAAGGQGNVPQTARPDVPSQPGAPATPPTQQQRTPPQPALDPYGQQPGQGGYGQGGYGQGGYRPMEVPIAETKVTGRRVVQYIIDYVLAGIIPGLAYWLFDRGSGTLHGIGWLVATIISLAVYFIYWVALPHGHRGQTFGMRLFGIHVISKDGSKATMMQLFLRGIFLIIDTLIFGLVGFITILCSKYRQRIGDHVARTVVTPARFGAQD